jgi:hypothetical protein
VLNISSTVGPRRSGVGEPQSGLNPLMHPQTHVQPGTSANHLLLANQTLTPAPRLFPLGRRPTRAVLCPQGSRTPLSLAQGPLTNRASGGDDRSFRQDLHDAGAHSCGAAAVGVQVAQELLDNQVGVLRLGGGRRAGPQTATPTWPGTLCCDPRGQK